jgi:hypothetical protein
MDHVRLFVGVPHLGISKLVQYLSLNFYYLEMIPENLLACALKRMIVKEFASMTLVKCLL